jgi:hypothetical protein
VSGRWKCFSQLREYHPGDIFSADEWVAFQPIPEKNILPKMKLSWGQEE